MVTAEYVLKLFEKAVRENNLGGATALHLAARNNDIDGVRLWLKKGADVNAVWILEQLHYNALHIAVIKGNVDIVEVLLEAGADVDAELEACHTAFFLAFQKSHKSLMRVLIAWDANVKEISEAISDVVASSEKSLSAECKALIDLIQNASEVKEEYWAINQPKQLNAARSSSLIHAAKVAYFTESGEANKTTRHTSWRPSIDCHRI